MDRHIQLIEDKEINMGMKVTNQAALIATHYRVVSANFRTGHLTITDGQTATETTVGELSRATQQDNPGLAAAIYDQLHSMAIRAMHESRQQSIRSCSGHVSIRTTDVPFSGPINSSEPWPPAHGNICRIEVCRCDAQRHTNINGGHTEQGEWC